jgi:hypothetical protein
MVAYKVTNGNVYLQGNKLVGKFSEISFPDIKYKMTDFTSLGMLSDIELPSGIEKLEAKIKFTAIFADEFNKLTDITTPASLIFRGNKEGFTGNIRSTEENITISITGIGKNIPLGGFKANQMTEFELVVAVWACKVTDAGKPVIEFDAFSNTLMVGGKNLTQGFQLNT